MRKLCRHETLMFRNGVFVVSSEAALIKILQCFFQLIGTE